MLYKISSKKFCRFSNYLICDFNENLKTSNNRPFDEYRVRDSSEIYFKNVKRSQLFKKKK